MDSERVNEIRKALDEHYGIDGYEHLTSAIFLDVAFLLAENARLQAVVEAARGFVYRGATDRAYRYWVKQMEDTLAALEPPATE